MLDSEGTVGLALFIGGLIATAVGAVVGGMRSAAEGGSFWEGAASGAITAACTAAAIAVSILVLPASLPAAGVLATTLAGGLGAGGTFLPGDPLSTGVYSYFTGFLAEAVNTLF